MSIETTETMRRKKLTMLDSAVHIDLAVGYASVRITLKAEYLLDEFTLSDGSRILREGNEYYLVNERAGTKRKLEPKELVELVTDYIKEEIKKGLIL
jgi:hypothetical protein